MKIFILIVSLNIFTLTSSLAQNLVINPSFEDTLDCPWQIGQVNFADGWSNWAVTPDYFNSCANATAPGYGTPVNYRGFQQPRTGQAYMGLFTFSIHQANFREFIGGTLSMPLTIGNLYFVTFWVSHADTSTLHFTTDKIGMKFSTVGFSQSQPDTANNSSHVFSTVVIDDTAGWVKIQGSFIADSAYTKFGIGNYFSDSLTTISQIGTGNTNYAYYLIDDVCVSDKADDCSTTTGIESHTTGHALTYPNPFDNTLVVTAGGINNLREITIYYSDGRIARSIKNLNSKSERFDMSEFPGGIYFLHVSDATNQKRVNKIVKR